MPPGIVSARSTRESIAPPQGSAPLRHLRSCLTSTPMASANPFHDRPLASFKATRRLGKSSGSTPDL